MSGSGRIYLDPGDSGIDDLVQTGEKIGVNRASHVSFPGSEDSFKRLKIATPFVVFDSKNVYPPNFNIWQEKSTLSGASVHQPNQAAIQLSIGTTAGAYIYRQTSEYFQYQPGKSQSILLTGVMGSIKSGVRQRIGYFDDNNGLFFQQDGSKFSVVQRSFTSSTTVDTVISSGAWNIDKLDGSGRSGITLDTSKAQIFSIDFQWLGVGHAVFGFNIDGTPIKVHEFRNANNLDSVYMSRGSLPVRFELENLTATASTTTMKQICCSVISDGSRENLEYPFVISNSTTGIAVSTGGYSPILGIRPAKTFHSLTNRAEIRFHSLTIESDVEIHYKITYNGTDNATSTSWQSVNSYSAMQYDASTTTITGGIIIDGGYVPATNNRSTIFRNSVSLNRFPLVVDMDGNTSTSLYISAKAISIGLGSANVHASINWHENY